MRAQSKLHDPVGRVVDLRSLLIILGLLWSISARSVQAQRPVWQTPVQLYVTENEVGLRPLLLGDNSGRLHLLWNEIEVEADRSSGWVAIYYMVKEKGQWSEPVDVLAQAQGYMASPRGPVDPYGRIHLTYGGLNEPSKYSQTDGVDGESAQSWSQAVELSDQRQVGGSIILDSTGRLHVVNGTTVGSIHHLISSDWGQSWSGPTVAALLPSGQAVIDGGPLLAGGGDGSLHMAWTLVSLPDGYPPLGSFYARSTDGGQSWSEPIEIAPAHYEVVSILAADDGLVHVLYIGRVGFGARYHRWSSDGGLTWSAPQPLVAPEEGSGGLSGGYLALDAAGTLHAVFGAPDGPAHSQWDGRTWSRWEGIARGAPGAMEGMTIAITRGNRLHAVWESDHNSIWYVEGRAAAPEVPAVPFSPLPTATPEATRSIPARAPTPTSTVMIPQADWQGLQPQAVRTSGNTVLLIGALPSGVIVGGALVWQLMVKRRG